MEHSNYYFKFVCTVYCRIAAWLEVKLQTTCGDSKMEKIAVWLWVKLQTTGWRLEPAEWRRIAVWMEVNQSAWKYKPDKIHVLKRGPSMLVWLMLGGISWIKYMFWEGDLFRVYDWPDFLKLTAKDRGTNMSRAPWRS